MNNPTQSGWYDTNKGQCYWDNHSQQWQKKGEDVEDITWWEFVSDGTIFDDVD